MAIDFPLYQKKYLPFATRTVKGTAKLDWPRLLPAGGLFRKDSWQAIAKSAPESVAGMSYFLPVFAFMAARANPGEKLATFAPEVAGIGTSFFVTPAVTAALSAVPGFSMLPVGARSFAGVIAAQFLVNAPITEKMGSFLREANHYTRRKRSLDMGGGYQDSRGAASARAAAIQEMSSAFGTARRYLGQEAMLMHG